MFFVVTAHAQQKFLNLDSSNPSVSWKVQPGEIAGADGTALPALDLDTKAWVKADVPGTTFGSYVNAGLEKDPNFGDNIYQVDKKKYERDFWYRGEFHVPATSAQKIWLNFEGVNRKGEIYFNGTSLGKLDAFMDRGKFDVTALVKKNAANVLAVLVRCPQEPIANYDMPGYMSSASWDWMPHVPGLLSGITDDVYLTTSNQVTITDPWVRTKVPSLTSAEISLQTRLDNHSDLPQMGTLSGVIQPGNIIFSQAVTLAPGESKTVSFAKENAPALVMSHPRLWWPNGYGDPNLYHCNLKFTVAGKTSDSKDIPFGIKQYSYDTDGNVFHLHVNGKRIFMKGGNWGMSEYMLRCRGAEYDLKVKLHREMNFNMIRNWIGSTTDDEFYQACDKYGILVWDDFWLNSHPNLPRDVDTFNHNAIEKIKRLRNHPSVALWCGDNEGTPIEPLNTDLRQDVATYDGGDRWYQPCSNTGALSGSGPWTNFDTGWYFTKYPQNFSNRPSFGMRSEMGTAVFTNFESFKKFMPKENWWPRNDMWDKHFFGKSAGNAGPDRYDEAITKEYGAPTGIEDYCRKAQLLNIETNKAMFEGWQHNMWDDASGILTWMSQSAYPSMVWQTYDYYYDLNGAYWGAKKGCEPLHIQWSSADNSVKVINTTSNDLTNVKAEATVYSFGGIPVPGMTFKKTLARVPSDSAKRALKINFNPENLASVATATASSEEGIGKEAANAIDGGVGSRWSSSYSDDQWIMLDFGAPKTFTLVRLIWESAYGKAYILQVSDDNANWRDVYSKENGQGGVDEIQLPPTTARYIRMAGVKRGSTWGYSLYEFEVYAKRSLALTKVHYIGLKLSDAKGKLLSENFYWRSQKGNDYTDLNALPKAQLKVTSKTSEKDGRVFLDVTVANPLSAPPAIAIRVMPVLGKSGAQILPVMMDDDYFSLMKGQSKTVHIEFDKILMKGEGMDLRVEPYNEPYNRR